MPERLGALAGIGPADVLAALELVREGVVVDLSIPLDRDVLPPGDPAFNRPLERIDVMAPAEWAARVGSGRRGFHLDAFGGSLHQGTHLDGLTHVVEDGRVFGGHLAAARTERGWTRAGMETVPPILLRGVLLDVAAVHGRLTGSREITPDDVAAVLEARRVELRSNDAVLVRTGRIADLYRDRATFLDQQPGIGLDAARFLVERGMTVYGSDTAGTEPQPVSDWERTVHVELLVHRGIHLLEWLDLDGLARRLDERGRTDFLLVVLPLPIVGATGSWVRPIAVL